MTQWLKTLTGSMCVITILMHIVPGGKFRKYVRFYGGLLFFLIAVRPVLNFFAGDGELERLIQLEFLKEEYYDMETSIAGIEELKDSRITEAYREEMRRQIREMADACGLEVSEITLQFEAQDAYIPEQITLTVTGGADTEAEALKNEIAGLYSIAERKIQIVQAGGER
jgi:stage III sporulation protein AF